MLYTPSVKLIVMTSSVMSEHFYRVWKIQFPPRTRIVGQVEHYWAYTHTDGNHGIHVLEATYWML